MYAAKGTQAYAQIGVESAVMSASQQQLVTMLFDGVLSALVRARLVYAGQQSARQRRLFVKSDQHH